MKLEREIEFQIEDVVYVKTDERQLERLVQAILVKKNDISYQVALNEGTCYFNSFELSKEKNSLLNKTKGGFI